MEPISSNCQYDFCSLYNTGYIYIYIAGDYQVLLLSSELRFRRKEKKEQIPPLRHIGHHCAKSEPSSGISSIRPLWRLLIRPLKPVIEEVILA